jgi:predicted transposase YdaD
LLFLVEKNTNRVTKKAKSKRGLTVEQIAQALDLNLEQVRQAITETE